MDTKRITAFAGAAACAVSLGATSLASASNTPPTFANTLPFANKLCTEVKAGAGNAHRKAVAPKIIEDCTELETKFQELRSAELLGMTSVRAGFAANKLAFDTACPKPTATTNTPAQRVACHAAKRLRQATAHRLFLQRFTVITTFIKGVDEARLKFWTAIKALKGQNSIKPDATIPLPKHP